MFWKTKKQNPTHQKIREIEYALVNSFGNVKTDVGGLKEDIKLMFQWVEYLRLEGEKKDGVISQLHQKIDNISAQLHSLETRDFATKGELQEMFNSYQEEYSSAFVKVSSIHEKINAMDVRQRALLDDLEMIRVKTARIDELDAKIKPLSEQVFAPKPAPQEVKPQKIGFKSRIMRKIKRGQKDYTKSLIMSLIGKYEKISALELREMIVDEQGLCSKSSFYRLLEDLEKEEEIASVHEGKEKFYFAKTTSPHSRR